MPTKSVSPAAPAAGTSFFAKTTTVLRAHPAFSRYMAGTAVSMTGTWMQVAAQGFLMATLTDRAFLLGLVNFANGIPMLALTFKGGSFADRHDKRRILVIAQFVQLALCGILGGLILSHHIAYWHILAAAIIFGCVQAFEVPADSALVPELVDKESIGTAIAVDRALFHATRFIGPALAGLLIAGLGMAAAYFLNALSFLALVAAVFTLAPRPRGTVEEEQKRAGGMKDGIAYVRNDRATMAMIGLLASSTLFISPIFMVMMPLYVTHVLGLGPDKLGYLMSVSGMGSLTGAIGLLAIPPEKRLGRMMLASGAATLATFGFGVAPNFYVAAVCMAFMSVGLSTNFGLANTIVQERAPDYLRGRVSALTGLSFFGLMPFASLGMPALADALGMRPTMLLGGGLYAVAAGFILLGPGRRACLECPRPADPDQPGEALRPDPSESPAGAGQPVAAHASEA